MDSHNGLPPTPQASWRDDVWRTAIWAVGAGIVAPLLAAAGWGAGVTWLPDGDPDQGAANFGLLLWPVAMAFAGAVAGVVTGGALAFGIWQRRQAVPRPWVAAALCALLTGGVFVAAFTIDEPLLLLALPAAPVAAGRLVR